MILSQPVSGGIALAMSRGRDWFDILEVDLIEFADEPT